MLRFAALAIACLIVAASPDASAQDYADAGTLSLTYENDFFGPTDRNYTNGVRAGWVTGEKAPYRYEGALVRLIAGDDPARLRRSYALGHSIYTPRDTLATEYLPDQHPYAGYLYGEYGLFVEQEGRLDRIALQLGIVGPTAGGEWIQNEFHDLIDEAPVLGWDNQVGDEVIVSASYDAQWQAVSGGDRGLGFDVVPNVGGRLGNFQTYASAGVTVRVGSHLAGSYGPPRVEPGLPGAGVFAATDGFAWHVFAGVQGRAVAHDITLDGSFLDGDGDPSVESQTFVGDANLGFALQHGGFQVAYTHVLRSDEFEQQLGTHEFGSLTLGFRF